MKVKTLRRLNKLAGRIVLVRVDFNVPFAGGKIKDDERLVAGAETIKFLLAQRARLVIITHLGEPSGPDKKYSCRPLAARLQKILKQPVKFLPETIGSRVSPAVKKLRPGEILFLENLRFFKEEYANDTKFARSLAALADIYVNDAFSVCHRRQASVAAIKDYLPSYAGLLLEQEIVALNKVRQPKPPLVIILGGSKLSTKLPLILKLYKSASQILLGGALANIFFKYQRLGVGLSVCESVADPYALRQPRTEMKKLFPGGKLRPKIVLPLDLVVKNKSGRIRVTVPTKVKTDEAIFDIGPATISLYAQYIKKAQTLAWNGPLGKFEEASFKHGTLAIGSLIAARSSGRAYGVVGGGETIEALRLTKMSHYVDWVSMAGGAMLSYLGGEKMPGLSKIIS